METSKDEPKKCPLCKGTGIAKCFDFEKNKNLPDGSYDLNYLIKKNGTWEKCPEESCKDLNEIIYN